MIKDITIKHFRGLEEFEVKEFQQFNIFVGENSCGKTSILEAIFMCYNAEEPNYLIRIQNFRKTIVVPTNISSIFYNFDFSKPIEFYSNYDSRKIEVKIYPKILKDFIPQENLKQNFMLELYINGLEFEINNDGQKSRSSFSIQPNGDVFDIAKNNKNPLLLALYLPSDIENWALKYSIDAIRKEKKKDELIDYLRLFDERILDIETLENNVLVNLEGIDKLININFLGEGFKKYTSLLALMLTVNQWHTHFCICIDEIENGLHFSSMKQLLNSIKELSKKFKFQFFFTTHSLEFLDIARNILGNQSKIFRIASTKKGVKAYPYLQEGEAYFTLDRIDPRGNNDGY